MGYLSVMPEPSIEVTAEKMGEEYALRIEFHNPRERWRTALNFNSNGFSIMRKGCVDIGSLNLYKVWVCGYERREEDQYRQKKLNRDQWASIAHLGKNRKEQLTTYCQDLTDALASWKEFQDDPFT